MCILAALAVDALALFPASPMNTALEQVVAFCLARSHEQGRHTREGGYPVRRGFSVELPTSLEYWVTRLRG